MPLSFSLINLCIMHQTSRFHRIFCIANFFFQVLSSSVSSPSQVAEKAGLTNHGQIGQLEGHYLLCSVTPGSAAGIWSRSVRPGDVLAAHPHVLWHSQERVLSRSKRSMSFNDPNYPKQWHLVRIRAAPSRVVSKSGSLNQDQSGASLTM